MNRFLVLVVYLSTVLCNGSCARDLTSERGAVSAGGDTEIGRAFAEGLSDIPVQGEGTVTRTLPNDLNPPRHQRFIVRLASGQTLLVTHNIDLGPAVGSLREGDTVMFKGEYVWNEKGGFIHWTHHDPKGLHDPGWIKHNGKTYQ